VVWESLSVVDSAREITPPQTSWSAEYGVAATIILFVSAWTQSQFRQLTPESFANTITERCQHYGQVCYCGKKLFNDV